MLLARLFFVLILSMALVVGYRWWRTLRSDRSGMLDAFEIKQLSDMAKSNPKLSAALVLRAQIVEATPSDGKREISIRIDQAIRRLMRQEILRKQIVDSVSDGARAKLTERISDTQTAATAAKDTDQRQQKESMLVTLNSQLEQLDRLLRRKEELEVSSDRVVTELKTIHLAILEASTTELSLSDGRVGGLLKDLEETSEQIRQKALANDEVERMLASARQTEHL